MLSILTGMCVLLISAFLGTLVWASADLPVALREIAINTRHDKSGGSTYLPLTLLGVLVKCIAVFLWAAGLILSYYIVFNRILLNLPPA